MADKKLLDVSGMQVKQGSNVSLKDFPTKYEGNDLDKENAQKLEEESLKELMEMQDELYAENKYSVLIILQAMDTAGKDGIVKHVISGLNPVGVTVASFKAPTSIELEHDYFWRHYRELPRRGDVGIFNRSHYENVLVTKVHPELILNEHLPEISTVNDIDNKFWERRYKQINRFEKNLYQNGIIILKFFLHISKKEQKQRLLARIDDPQKNWKFEVGDLKERGFWKNYQHAYEECFSETSTDYAPWFIIPSDEKWFSRLAVSTIVGQEFKKLNLSYPEVSEEQKKALQQAKIQLMSEPD